jgi:hypothetical protein
MHTPMQATERNIPMKEALESAEKNLAELHAILVDLAERLRPVLTPESKDCAGIGPGAPMMQHSPIVMDIHNLAFGITAATNKLGYIFSRIEV